MPVFTIADSASLSDAKLITGPIVGIHLPASLEGTSLTFSTSDDRDGTYDPVYDASGAEFQVAAGSSRYIACHPSDFAWATGKYIKVRTGLAGSATNQSGAATITVDLGNLT